MTDQRKSHLHELLAVESSLQGQSDTIIAESKKMFSNKHHLFSGKMRTLTIFSRSEANETEIQALEAKEQVSTRPALTVASQLNYAAVPYANYLNVLVAKDQANRLAKADLIVDGEVLAQDVPGTVLLTLEQKLKSIRDLLDAAPTLDPSIDWSVDVNSAIEGVFRSPEVITVKTQKEPEYVTVSPATDKHAAQVVSREKTSNIGKYTDVSFSANMPVVTKASMLDRVDRLIRACKSARQRANIQEVTTSTLGDSLMRYVLGPVFDRKNTGLEK